ncbi:MAG: aldehyde dehydrogenase family protein [Defluviitaleaceae bacterium]|nr:aldehyde dehydrogenase family protein [Defluviitaleaceae bacterium]
MNTYMYIGGKQVGASDGAVSQNINPSTGASIGTVPAATKEDIDRALAFAVEGQKEWAAVPLYERIEIVYRFCALAEERAEEIGRAACLEGGKLFREAVNEAKVMSYVFRAFAEGARNHYGVSMPRGTEPRVKDDVLFTVSEPLGIVACIVPFNFPLELYAHKVAPALLMGNAVIIKPSSYTPLAASIVTGLLIEAGVNPKAVQYVTGSGAKIGDWLTASPLVSAVSLTGGTAAAVHIIEKSASNIPRLFFELGGNDPLVIFGDADVDLAVREAVGGRLTNAGQICCCSKRFIVHNSVREEFTKKLVDALGAVTPKDAMDADAVMGPVVSEAAAEEIIRQIGKTVEQGAECVLGGTREGAYVCPTVLTGVTPLMDISGEMEIFGPVFPIIGFDTAEEALEIANGTPYGLQGGVITADMKTAMKAAMELQCGAVVINGSGNYRSAHQPFGGYKLSGLGREGILTTLDEMSQTKTISFKGILA